MARTSSGTARHRTAAASGRDDAQGPVHRALAILQLLGSDDVGAPLGVVEIARRLGREKSQVSRTLRLLADAGFVDREPRTLRYRIGTRLFAVGAKAVDRRLRCEADRATRRLSGVLGERAEVAIRSGNCAMTISSAAPDRGLLAVGWVGREQALHNSAVGRALLLDVDSTELARLLSASGVDSATGPRSPRGYDEVLARLRVELDRGYCVCVDEAEHNLITVGAPIRDSEGDITAAVQLCGPVARIEHRLDGCVEQVIAGARDISAVLGCTPARQPAINGDRAAVPGARAGSVAGGHDGSEPKRVEAAQAGATTRASSRRDGDEAWP